MKFAHLLKEMTEGDELLDPVIYVDLDKSSTDEFSLGTAVQIATLEGLDPEDLGVSDVDFVLVKSKVAEGEHGLVFNDDDEGEYADVVFTDGIEVFGVPYSNLINVDEPDYEPSTDVDVDSI